MDPSTKELVTATQNLDGKAALMLLRAYRPKIKDIVRTVNESPSQSDLLDAEEGFIDAVMEINIAREQSLIVFATGYIKKAVLKKYREDNSLPSVKTVRDKTVKSVVMEYINQIGDVRDRFILLASTYGIPDRGNLLIAEIANELNMSESSVRKHRSKLLKALCCHLDEMNENNIHVSS